jgi:glycosyltransferase involved in cell wall biosynthesis
MTSSSNAKPRILIIIPAFNEESSVPFVANELKGLRYDVILIDDGSSDATSHVARRQGLKVISLPINLGIGGAVQTGFKYAREHNYEIAIQLDGDGQHRGDQIESIIAPVFKGQADLVIGSRVLEASYVFPRSRRLGGMFFSFLIGSISGVTVTDPTSGFRCYGKKALRLFSEQYPEDFPEVDSIVVACKNGLRILEVPVLMRQRHAGTSSISARASVYYMIKVALSLLVNAMRKKTSRGEH